MGGARDVVKPSQQLAAILSGAARKEDCTDAVRSWLQFSIYTKAKKVLALPFDERIIEIEKQPESLQELVKAECVRLNNFRRGSR